MSNDKSASPFKKVERKSLADAVFEQLRDEIVHGSIEPGDTLPAERGLSEMLGVNRGAVREALKRLEQARLITIQQGGATRVLNFLDTAGTDLLSVMLIRADGTINTDVARSVMEMRSAVASDIARIAARRAPDEIIAEAEALIDRMKAKRADLPALQDLSLEFWKVLVQGTGNIAYKLSINSLEESYDKFKRLMIGVFADEFSDIDRYHRVILALRDRDEEEASYLARQITSVGEHRIARIIEALEGEQEPTEES